MLATLLRCRIVRFTGSFHITNNALEACLVGIDVSLGVPARQMSSGSRRFRTGERKRARIARNHSSICPGLEDVLAHVQKEANGIKTIVPGRMFTARTSREHFSISISSATSQGFRLTARNGQTVQEVYCVTSIDEDTMQTVLDAATDAAVKGKRLARLQRRQLMAMDQEADALSLDGDEEGAATIRSKARALRNGAWSPSGGRTVRNPKQATSHKPGQPLEEPAGAQSQAPSRV